MPEYRIKVAPDTVAYADGENHKLVVEFAIPGAPTDTIDVKILEDSIHLTAPARDIEYVAALALGWPVKLTKPKRSTTMACSESRCPSKTRWKMQ